MYTHGATEFHMEIKISLRELVWHYTTRDLLSVNNLCYHCSCYNIVLRSQTFFFWGKKRSGYVGLATTANSASFVTVPPSTSTSINSSMPETETVTLTTNLLSITDSSPALQQQFSSLMQQYINNAALQPNLSPVSDCDNKNVSTIAHCYKVLTLLHSPSLKPLRIALTLPMLHCTKLPAINTSAMPLQLQNSQHALPQPLLY